MEIGYLLPLGQGLEKSKDKSKQRTSDFSLFSHSLEMHTFPLCIGDRGTELPFKFMLQQTDRPNMATPAKEQRHLLRH